MDAREQTLKALEFFKDWSNYILVATIAGLGWIAEHGGSPYSRWCFALSAIFGVFTLALIPVVAEQVDGKQSFYDIKVRFRLAWMWGKEKDRFQIKWVCWPQHVLLILGLVLYASKY